MENSKPLATESFSHSWLVHTTQHQLDIVTPAQSRDEKDHNFNFDASFTAIVHADEIFSDGHIMPVYVDRARVQKTSKTSTSVPHSPISSCSVEVPFDGSKKLLCFERWRRSSRRILHKFLALIRITKSSRVDDLERKVCEIGRWSSSLHSSPRMSSCKISNGVALKRARSWCASSRASPRVSPSRATSSWCGDESSIHEAILYCKRSIEK